MCAALCELFLKTTPFVRYFREADIYQKLTEAIENDLNSSSTLKFLMDDDVTIIDDLGSVTNSEWRKGVITEVLNLRYISEKPTVITSNFTRKKLLETYEPRDESRLFSSQNTIISLFGNEDLRQIGL